MPNTDHLQIRPDYVFDMQSKDRQPAGIQSTEYSNPRYRFFRQAHFTAGDEDQFLSFWDTEPSTMPTAESGITGKTPMDVYHTFAYLFHEMKKGIYARIRDKELTNFLPFSRADYENNFASFWRWDTDRFPASDDLFRWVTEKGGHPFHRERIHRITKEWYANNGLIRYEHPISESDSGVNMIRDMFLSLVRERDIPDIDIFINKRDFPVVSRDPTRHPYEAMYGTDPILISRKARMPVLSMTTTVDHMDIPIPTWEDWCRASYQQNGKIFPKGRSCRIYPDIIVSLSKWEEKQSVAVFRGASTGLGVNEETNPRIRFAQLSRTDRNRSPDTGQYDKYIDVGITKWNLRPRRTSPTVPFDTFSETILSTTPLVPYMSLQEQASKYKYILHLPGHSFAYRLSYELGSGSVVIMYPCRYQIWYSHLLCPMQHYVPLAEDEDIFEKIEWCRRHDDLMQTIANNARQFYDTVLSRDGILDFLTTQLWDLHREHGLVIYPGRRSMTAYQALQRQQDESISPKFMSLSPDAWILEMRRATTQEEVTVLWKTAIRFLSDDWWENVAVRQLSRTIKKNRNTEIRQMDCGLHRFCLKIKDMNTSGWSDVETLDFQKNTDHERFITTVALKPLQHWGFFPISYGIRETRKADRFSTVMISHFITGRTMEQWIQSPWTSTDALVTAMMDVLCQIALMLDWMQDVTGFMHMDLYPWNIMIIPVTHGKRKKKFPVWLSRPSRKDYQMTFMEQTEPSWNVSFVDFGRSFVLYKGCLHENVSPFVMNRMHDMITIVWNSIFILFKAHRLSPSNVYTIRSLLRFFDPILPTRFQGGKWKINELLQYLQVHKRFSRLLYETMENPMPKTMTPVAFSLHLQRLMNSFTNFPNKFRVVRNTSFRERVWPHPPPDKSTIDEASLQPPPCFRIWEAQPAITTYYHSVWEWLQNLHSEKDLEGCTLPFKPSDLIFVHS